MAEGDFPTTSPRWRVRDRARAVLDLAQRAMELTTEGPRMDVARAERLLERAGALLGVSAEGSDTRPEVPASAGTQ